MQTDFNKLIPELAMWNDGAGISVTSWIQCVGNYEHAIAYAELLWPEFEEHDGCIFHKGFSEKTYEDWMSSASRNKTAVESVMNHVHILDLFPNVEPDPSKEQIAHVGRKLREIWEVKLRHDLPERDVTVSFSDEDCDDLLEYVVTFYQERQDTTT